MKTAEKVICKISYVLFVIYSLWCIEAYARYIKLECVIDGKLSFEHEPIMLDLLIFSVVCLVVSVIAIIKNNWYTRHLVPICAFAFSMYHLIEFDSLDWRIFNRVTTSIFGVFEVYEDNVLVSFIIFVCLVFVVFLLSAVSNVFFYISKKKVKENAIPNSAN